MSVNGYNTCPKPENEIGLSAAKSKQAVALCKVSLALSGKPIKVFNLTHGEDIAHYSFFYALSAFLVEGLEPTAYNSFRCTVYPIQSTAVDTLIALLESARHIILHTRQFVSSAENVC